MTVSTPTIQDANEMARLCDHISDAVLLDLKEYGDRFGADIEREMRRVIAIQLIDGTRGTSVTAEDRDNVQEAIDESGYDGPLPVTDEEAARLSPSHPARLIYEQRQGEIQDGMLQWEPGTLSTAVMNRVLTDVLADVWQDCYRRGEAHAIRVSRFRGRIACARYAATGERELG